MNREELIELLGKLGLSGAEELIKDAKEKEIEEKALPALFQSALTHRSFIEEANPERLTGLGLTGKDSEHYDRLEFFGDSVLKTVINQHLFAEFETYNSGQLSKLSAYLLSDKVLIKIAKVLEIEKSVRLGKRVGRVDSILGDVMEALLGACYLCFGHSTTTDLIIRLYSDEIKKADSSALKGNYKAALQEYAQARALPLPKYIVLKSEGPSHMPTFEIQVKLDGKRLGKGKGPSKKDAEQEAAKKSLKMLKD